MKIIYSILSVSILVFFMNCSFMMKSIPNQPIDLENVDYTVSGISSGEACQKRFLIFFFGLGSDFGFTPGAYTGLQRAAIYDALVKLDTADAVISPKFDYEDNNYLIYQKTCAKVNVKGITYK
ncbi:MAG: hypothetical protein O9346_08925 [Leptospiraceae bacterium]|nr:hypothetical protein [Leptospiraceae bacterium]MCZ8346525.1 hypothetical protein [Leptospiraceae bacterium]